MKDISAAELGKCAIVLEDIAQSFELNNDDLESTESIDLVAYTSVRSAIDLIDSIILHKYENDTGNKLSELSNDAIDALIKNYVGTGPSRELYPIIMSLINELMERGMCPSDCDTWQFLEQHYLNI